MTNANNHAHKREAWALQASIIIFPGSNCDRDAQSAFVHVCGTPAQTVWHGETDLPSGTDLVILPGGFSWGDYLRPGAMAVHAAIMPAVCAHIKAGGYALGVCNGFQVLTEAAILPGALMRNAGLNFVCRQQSLEVEAHTDFTCAYAGRNHISIPIAHMDGNYRADKETLARLDGEGRIVFRYADRQNPNGSMGDIAGIVSPNGRVLGMMPHPERAVDAALGHTDGRGIFDSLSSRV